MIRIDSISAEALARFDVVSVAPGGRTREVVEIPVMHATASGLPEPLDALVVVGDLQAIDSDRVAVPDRVMAGVSMAESLAIMAELGQTPAADRTGVLLTGDLYTDPALERRGTDGDVQAVWAAFAAHFRWVAGVAGNHDTFGGRASPRLPASIRNGYLLDDETVTLDGLAIAGLCGIVGPSRKPWRREEPDFLDAVARRLRGRPDVLLLHESPAPSDGSQRGHAALGALLRRHEHPLLVACGHVRWSAMSHVEGSVHVVNADARVVYLTRGS